MDFEQYEAVSKTRSEPSLIGVHHLQDQTPRTLIYGYYSDGITHHVYLGPDKLIHILLYREVSRSSDLGDNTFMIVSHTFGEFGGAKENGDYIPTKRSYPESCDFEFCELLARENVNLHFTTFNHQNAQRRLADHHGFAGYVMGDDGIEVVPTMARFLEMVDFPPKIAPNEVAPRILVEACRDVSACSLRESVDIRVEKAKLDEVLVAAKRIHESISWTLLLDSNILENIVTDIFDTSRLAFGSYDEVKHISQEGGTLSCVLVGVPNKFKQDSGVQYYSREDSKNGYPIAVSGDYRGHRFTAMIASPERGECELSLCEFGDSNRLVRLLENPYGLTKVPMESAV